MSLDLFGGEVSSNAAEYFACGLKGRANERKYEDHVALEGTYAMAVPEDGRLRDNNVPLRNAMNEILRDAYIDDNQRGVDMWNKTIADHGIDLRLSLPSRRFNRRIGIYADLCFSPAGESVTRQEFERRKDDWLPSESDRAYVGSLMQPVLEPGRMANWIAAPTKGIDGKPLTFEYVRLA